MRTADFISSVLGDLQIWMNSIEDTPMYARAEVVGRDLHFRMSTSKDGRNLELTRAIPIHSVGLIPPHVEQAATGHFASAMIEDFCTPIPEAEAFVQ